jgi:hypothetical protein
MRGLIILLAGILVTVNCCKSHGKIEVDSWFSYPQDAAMYKKIDIKYHILPFCIKGGKGIRIASITEEVPVEMTDGDYSVIIQTGNIDSENEWCNLSFIKSTELSDTPRILKSDLTITKKENLLLTAYPA